MKKLVLVLFCMVGTGCTDENVDKVQKAKWNDDPSTTFGDMLNNRPICKETDWSSVTENGITTVSYSCELTNYDNQLLRIVNRDIIKHEKDNEKMLRKYKEDIDISDFRLDQLSRLEKAIEELNENGIAGLYKLSTEKLNMNNLDYSYVFKGPIEPIVPVEGYDDEAQKNLYTSLKIIQETFLRHGLVREAYTHVGLNRSKTKNIDYLKLNKEDRDKWLSFDRDLITQRKISTVNALKELETNLPKQVERYNKLGNMRLVASIKQNAAYQLVDNIPVPVMCRFDYVTFNGVNITIDDDTKKCFNMAYSASYDLDFQELFNGIYQKILQAEIQ